MNKIAYGAYCLLSLLLCGCSRSQSEVTPGRLEAKYQFVAQAYFRLGVSCCHAVILTHEIKGTPVPSGAQMLAECKEWDRTHGGDKDTLIQSGN